MTTGLNIMMFCIMYFSPRLWVSYDGESVNSELH